MSKSYLLIQIINIGKMTCHVFCERQRYKMIGFNFVWDICETQDTLGEEISCKWHSVNGRKSKQ